MTVFTAAVNVLFADPNLSVAGTFTASPLAPISVRAIITQSDPVISFGETGVRSPGVKILLKAIQVTARPPEGSTVTIGSTTYTVRDARLDPHGLEWTLDVDSTGG